MDEYKRRTKAQGVYALCFSNTNQSYHHWRIFAGGDVGVCIAFKRDALRKAIDGISNMELQEVEYVDVKHAKDKLPLSDENLKFMKHIRYADEKEIRAVFTGKPKKDLPYIPIQLTDIDRITLSPWLARSLSKNIKCLVRQIEGCKKLKVYNSTLVDFKDWKSLAAKT